MRTLVIAAALLGVLPPMSYAQAPDVQAVAPWARPTAPRQSTGAAYMQLRSAAGDRLLRASSPIAARAEVHETRMDGAIMRMREVAALDLPPGQAVALAPGGTHVMLVGLKERLMPGQRFPLRLEFERSSPLDVTVVVGQPSGSDTGHAH